MLLSLCKRLYRTGELRCKTASIGPEVDGFIYRSRKGNLYILVDDSVSPEARTRAFLHETHHAAADMPAGKYVLGLDDRRSRRERAAEEYATREY
jgi:hypothetical protein